MISSDLPELIGMCDRVLVMHQGKIKGELMKKDFSEELILSYAAGLDNETNQHSMHVGTGEGGQSGYDQA